MDNFARSETVVLDVAPLCPAGHLPHKGGDRTASMVSPIFYAPRWSQKSTLPISPPVGEMSGRTEGGANDRSLSAVGASEA